MKKNLLLLIGIVVIAFGVRLYKLSTPLADWHSWRQADTASVTREFVKHNYSLLESHYHDLSDIPNGLNNAAGYRMVEFPIVNFVIAQVIRWQPSWDLVVVSRLFSIGFSLVSVAGLYLGVYFMTKNRWLASVTALVFALLPYSIFYSRVILPEPAMVMGQVVALSAFVAWLQRVKAKQFGVMTASLYFLSVVAMMFALLMKPMAIFLAPVLVVAACWILGGQVFKQLGLWLYPVLVLAPMLAWRHWIAQYPSGIPASSWLFNGNGIRLRPAWWRWLFADRLGRLILGYWGTVFVVLGAILQEGRKRLSLFDAVTLTWLAMMGAYLVVFATGNVQHDYYQAMLMPVISILFARGLVFGWTHLKNQSLPMILAAGLAACLFLTGLFTWNEVRGYYNINNPAIVVAGQAVDRLTPADAKVIAPYQGDTAFLFQTNRTGWPIGGRIEEKIKLGAQYYVTTAEDDEAKALQQLYRVIEKTPTYMIIELK